MRLHPRPQTKPRTVRQAFEGIESQRIDCPPLTPLYSAYWHKARPGDVVGKFACRRKLHPDRPANTLPKSTSHFHPWEPRVLTSLEMKRLSSFPDDFEFRTWINALHRIGNSVPPLLMEAIARHIRKNVLKTRKKPTVVSTFAGCGGSSLGYHLAGYTELLAVEWDADAAKTLKDNFKGLEVYHGDINDLSVEECLNRIKLKAGELDVLDGSPPCQGFSLAANKPRNEAFQDSRNDLFQEFVRLLKGLKPRAFVMENVTGMIRGVHRLIFLEILKQLRAAGYFVEAQVLNASHYGVPQARERVIFVGIRNDLKK